VTTIQSIGPVHLLASTSLRLCPHLRGPHQWASYLWLSAGLGLWGLWWEAALWEVRVHVPVVVSSAGSLWVVVSLPVAIAHALSGLWYYPLCPLGIGAPRCWLGCSPNLCLSFTCFLSQMFFHSCFSTCVISAARHRLTHLLAVLQGSETATMGVGARLCPTCHSNITGPEHSRFSPLPW
jgi:hypothetical protein